MPDVVQIAIEAVDKASAVFQKVGDSLDQLGKKGEEAGAGAAQGAQGFESFAGKLVAVQAGIAVAQIAIAGLKEVWDFSKEGAASQQISASFDRTTESIGSDADEIVKKLDEAAKGTIGSSQLMQASTRALTLGVAKSGDDLVKVMQLARSAALQFGGDTATAFESINYAIGNLAPRALKQYGIIVSLKDANEEYAKSIGVSVDTLTEAEQRQALLNAVLEQGKKNFGDISDAATTTAEHMKAVEVRIQEDIDKVKEFMALGFGTIFTINDAAIEGPKIFTANVANMKKEVMAGRMSTDEYNKAVQDLALTFRDYGIVLRQVDVDAEKLNATQLIGMQIANGAVDEYHALANAIKQVSDAAKAAAATDLSKLTPEQQQAAVTAYQSYQSKITDIEVKGDDKRVEAVGDAMDALAKLEADTGQKRSDIISQFASDEASRLSDMNDKRIDILMGYSANEQKITAQQYKDRMKLARDFGAETQRMEEEHQRQMQRMGEDHTRNLRKLADSRDALGIEDEQENYRIERRRAEEDYQIKAAQRNEDYARQLADQNAAFEEQRKQRADDREKQLADLQKNFEKQDAKYQATYKKQLADLDKHNEEERQAIWIAEGKKMQDIATAQAAERIQANAEWTAWRNQHDIFFANERKAYDDYLKYTYDQLQAYINKSGAATPATTAAPKPATVHGYAAGANFVVPAGYANDAYPLRVSSGERVRVTPAGQSAAIPAITITQTFSGAQAEPEKYKSIMYQVITDVIEQAMRQ